MVSESITTKQRFFNNARNGITMDSDSKEIKKLINKCRKGNRAAQKELYKKFFAYGMSVSLHYSRSKEEAQEILNDGFMKVFTKLDKYSDNLSFKAWLRTILVNTAVDNYRKNKKHDNTIDISYIAEPSVGNYAEEKMSLDDIMKMVQRLPRAYRMVFNLYAGEGYKHAEIAEKLGISEGTSKSNYSKARGKLQKMIEEQYEQENISRYGT